ncbi:hypothetical protein OROHE_014426 [Orobanche hederae]
MAFPTHKALICTLTGLIKSFSLALLATFATFKRYSRSPSPYERYKRLVSRFLPRLYPCRIPEQPS